MILLFSSTEKKSDDTCEPDAASSQCSGQLSCGSNNKCECQSNTTRIGVDECSNNCSEDSHCDIEGASCKNGNCQCDSAHNFHNTTTNKCEKSKYC